MRIGKIDREKTKQNYDRIIKSDQLNNKGALQIGETGIKLVRYDLRPCETSHEGGRFYAKEPVPNLDLGIRVQRSESTSGGETVTAEAEIRS